MRRLQRVLPTNNHQWNWISLQIWKQWLQFISCRRPSTMPKMSNFEMPQGKIFKLLLEFRLSFRLVWTQTLFENVKTIQLGDLMNQVLRRSIDHQVSKETLRLKAWVARNKANVCVINIWLSYCGKFIASSCWSFAKFEPSMASCNFLTNNLAWYQKYQRNDRVSFLYPS